MKCISYLQIISKEQWKPRIHMCILLYLAKLSGADSLDYPIPTCVAQGAQRTDCTEFYAWSCGKCWAKALHVILG